MVPQALLALYSYNSTMFVIIGNVELTPEAG